MRGLILALMIGAGLTTACGKRGDLYLPDTAANGAEYTVVTAANRN